VLSRKYLDRIIAESGVSLRPSHAMTSALIASHCALSDLLQRLYECSHYDGGRPGHICLVVPEHMLAELREVSDV